MFQALPIVARTRVVRALILLILVCWISPGIGHTLKGDPGVFGPVAGRLVLTQSGQKELQAKMDLKVLLTRIEVSRAQALERRISLFEDLVSRSSLEARQASLALLEGENPSPIRVLLLRHIWSLPDVEGRMLRELETGTVETRSVAARYFYQEQGREGFELLLALDAEKSSPLLHIAILRVLGGAGKPDADKAFAARFRKLDEVYRSQVLVALRGKRSRTLTTIRRQCLGSKRGDLKGEAILQLVQEKDREALALLPKLARSKSSIVLAERLMDALFLHSKPKDLVLAADLLARSPGLRAKLKYRIPDLIEKPGVRKWAAGDGARHPQQAVRRLALDLLRGKKDEDSIQALYLLTQDKKRELRLDALVALSHWGDRRIEVDLWKLLEKGRPEERYQALLALDRLLGDEPAYLNRLLVWTRKGNSALRFLALDLASRHGLRELLGLLPGLLSSADWRLRSLGYMVASRVRDKESIPLLIQAIKKESGRTEFECGQALKSLTRYYCRTAEDWERWWEKQKDGFVLPPPAPAEPDTANKGKGSTVAEFYGIPVRSHRVVYVLDVSGSMSAQFGTGSTRIKVARESLKTALKKADKSSLVNVIFFDNKVRSYAKKSVPIRRKGELNKLLAYVDKARPLGGTNIHGALLAAFKDPRVDTIFLLSDGDPSTGEITDIQDLATAILRLNRARRVKIHCVAVGLESPLLRRLAGSTGGQYVKY